MSFEMLKAELAQCRAAYQKAMGERETYIRIVACLASYISAGKQIPMVDGHPVVYQRDFVQVPKLWSVNVIGGELEEPEPAPEAGVEQAEKPCMSIVEPAAGDPGPEPEKKTVPALIVVVEPKLQGPRLVVPRGVPQA